MFKGSSGGHFENVLLRSPELAAQLALYLKLVRNLIINDVQSFKRGLHYQSCVPLLLNTHS